MVLVTHGPSETPYHHDTWSRCPHFALRQLLHLVGTCHLHIWYTSLADDEISGQVHINIFLPHVKGRGVFHSLIVWPIWMRDTSIVDQTIDPIIKMFGCCLDCLANCIRIGQVAYCPGDLGAVLFEMDFGGMLQLFFVNIQKEYLVTLLSEVASQRTADT